MSGFFQRLFTLGSAEAHGVLEKLEDPVKMTEQGIRDLNKDLAEATNSFAQIKAIAISADRDMVKAKNESQEWEHKAMALLQQGQSGKMDPAKADQLATEALKRKGEAQKQYATHASNYQKQSLAVSQVQQNIEKLKSTIQQFENELITLKARATTAKATTKINKQLAQADPNGTVAMLERMRQKVDEQESLAQAYGEIAQEPTSVEDEINQALLGSEEAQQLPDSSPQSDELAALKARLGNN